MAQQISRVLGLMIVVAMLWIAPRAFAGGSAPHCTVAQLSVTEGLYDGAAGHIMIPIHFRNVSRAPCTLFGYPGAAGLDAHGKQVVQAKRVATGFSGGVAAGGSIPLVVVKPGQEGTARIDGSDVPGPSGHPCRDLHGLLVTPPNDHRSVRLREAPPSCRLQIHPVIKGASGTQ